MANSREKMSFPRWIFTILLLAGLTGSLLTLEAASVSAAATVSTDDASAPDLTFGVLSDTHVGHSFAPVSLLAEAFVFYDDSAVDALTIVGDLTESGTAAQFNSFKSTRETHFAQGKLLTSMGNHEGGNVQNYENGTDNKANYVEVVNGYYFIFISPGSGTLNPETGRTTTHGGDQYGHAVNWLKEQLAIAESASPDKPIFVFFHHPIRDTHYTSNLWYGRGLETVFDGHPRVVTFSGHNHEPHNIPLAINQDKGYTTLGTSTLKDLWIDPTIPGVGNIIEGDYPPNASNMGQGMLVEVRGCGVTVKNYDFIAKQWIDQTWTFQTADALEDSYFPHTTVNRVANAVKPFFPQDAKASVTDVTETGARLEFSRASIPENTVHDMVQAYRIDFIDVATGEVALRVVKSSEFYFLPQATTIFYQTNALVKGTEYVTRIYAVDAFGLVSDQYLSADFTTLGEAESSELTFDEMRAGIPKADKLDVNFADGKIIDHSPMARLFENNSESASNIVANSELEKHVGEINKNPAHAWKTTWSAEDWAAINKSLTMETVFRLDNPVTNSWMGLLGGMQSSGVGFDLYSGDANHAKLDVSAYINNGYRSPSSDNVIEFGKWYHAVATYDGAHVKLYLNGELIASVASSGTIATPGVGSQWFVIGGDISSSGGIEAPLDGAISLARIYSTPLTAKQIRMLAARELATNDTAGPILQINGTPGNVVADGDGENYVLPAVLAADNSGVNPAITVTLSTTADENSLMVYEETYPNGMIQNESIPTQVFRNAYDTYGVTELTLAFSIVDKAGNRTKQEFLIQMVNFEPPVTHKVELLWIDGKTVLETLEVPEGRAIDPAALSGILDASQTKTILIWLDAKSGSTFDLETPILQDLRLMPQQIMDYVEGDTKPQITISGVSNGNKQGNVNFDIRSANGKGYTTYLSSADGVFRAYSNVNYNAKGAHIKKLTNGNVYYVFIEYKSGTKVESSKIVSLNPGK